MQQQSLDLTDDTSDQYFQNLSSNHQREVIDLMAKLIMTVFQSIQEETHDDSQPK
jgi:hypothetical protein